MIEYVEIRDSGRNLIGIIDTAKSIIWHSVFFGVGDFEIYAQLTDAHMNLLHVGNYVTRQGNDEVGIIENIEISYTVSDGYMIVASGRFAKSLLDRRLIYNLSGKTNTPTVLRGKVETAARQLVLNNIGAGATAARKIPFIVLGDLKNYPEKIIDDSGDAASKQVSYRNLLEYTDELLQEYSLGARLTLLSNKNLAYEVIKGADRSVGNTSGNLPVVFSPEYDNVIQSDYLYNDQELRNVALIGGEGEGLARFYVLVGNDTGLNRRELFVDASGTNRQYKDDNDEDQTYTDAEYSEMLRTQGQQELSANIIHEDFSGEINIHNELWQLGVDFQLGDVVTFQDNKIGKYINVRISEITEKQDDDGYGVQPVFAAV